MILSAFENRLHLKSLHFHFISFPINQNKKVKIKVKWYFKW